MLFDHLVVGGKTLEEATAHVEAALGLSMQPGGKHSVFHTHNALMGLEDGIYLEAIAADPAAEPPRRPRWYDLDRFVGPARLANWACSIGDMETGLDRMPDGVGSPVDVTRGALRWRMAVSPDGTTPFDNLWPALIQWPSGANPAARLAPTGARLRQLTLIHPEANAFASALTRHLKDPRITFETGAVAMRAVFDTPRGERTL